MHVVWLSLNVQSSFCANFYSASSSGANQMMFQFKFYNIDSTFPRISWIKIKSIFVVQRFLNVLQNFEFISLQNGANN